MEILALAFISCESWVSHIVSQDLNSLISKMLIIMVVMRVNSRKTHLVIWSMNEILYIISLAQWGEIGSTSHIKYYFMFSFISRMWIKDTKLGLLSTELFNQLQHCSWFLQAIFKVFKVFTGKETSAAENISSSKRYRASKKYQGVKNHNSYIVFLEVNFIFIWVQAC